MTIEYQSVTEHGQLQTSDGTALTALPVTGPSSAEGTLFASAARTAVKTNEAGTAIDISAYTKAMCVFALTNADTDAGDTLDVYVDVSPDGGTSWLNAAHFTQVIGTASAQTKFAILDRAAPGTAEIDATSDCTAGVVRPAAWGNQMRGRYTLVDADADASFTFSLKVLLQ